MEERKFVCKYCNKKFPCGKSLGGHIRTHMNEHSAQDHNGGKRNADRVKFDASRKRKKDFGSEAAAADDGSYIYGPRENPKKTTRFVHSNTATLHQEKFCKECGKGFPSLKALCGHMACHSEKEKGSNKLESNYGFSEKQNLIMDSHSDTETSAPTNQRRSRRTRFKKLDNHPSPVSLGNGSSSVSEVEHQEQEQEEVARCLMLLSKDSSHRGRFALLTDSSDNNSVVLETKSPFVGTRITVNNVKNSVSNAYELVEKKMNKEMKLKSAEISVSDNSDSGYFRYGPRKVCADVSVDGFFKNLNFKKPKVEHGSEFETYGETTKILNKCRNRSTESRKLVLEDVEYDESDGAKRKFNSKNGSLNHISIGASCKKTANDFLKDEIYGNGEKEWRYECLSSERVNGSYDSAYESDANSTDTDSYPAVKFHGSKALNQKKTSIGKKKLMSKKSRGHECPVCHKIFKSGQALGGHKRSHFVGGSEENTLVINQGPVAAPCLIDLNLPAPVDE